MGELEAAILIQKRTKGTVGVGKLGQDPSNMTSHLPAFFSLA